MSLHVLSKRPRRVREWLRGGVLACATEGYLEYLHSRGHTAEVTACYLGGVAHFAHWLTRTGRCVGDIDEALIKRFIDRHVPVCRCLQPCRHRQRELRLALTLLLQWLRQVRMVATVVPPRRPLEAEMDEFERYLSGVCGLAATTRYRYLRAVRHFLSACFGRRRIDVAQLTPRDVRGFIEEHGAHWRSNALRKFGTTLRSYLRFKAHGGAVVEPLEAVVPRIPHWTMTSLPKTLTQAQIKHFLEAFDRTCPKGLRDYAMARCLTDLGLRAIEVSRFRLEDIDWNEGTLRIRSKGGRVDLLPLPKALGAAIAEYLRHARPQNHSRALFVRWRAPRDQLTPSAIDSALRDTARRCGLGSQFTGLHLFRHSMACELLRHGASLKAIADVLRHRSFNTTTIYAKVDLTALKRVAMPWPGRTA
jgi:integrase/recombinase XerD